MSPRIASTPEPPYYAVIFSARQTDEPKGYGKMAARMVELAAEQPGFLGIETAHDPDGFGMTVSYWTDEAAVAAWKAQAEHQVAQRRGQEVWYAQYEIRVARVERAYGWSAP